MRYIIVLAVLLYRVLISASSAGSDNGRLTTTSLLVVWDDGSRTRVSHRCGAWLQRDTVSQSVEIGITALRSPARSDGAVAGALVDGLDWRCAAAVGNRGVQQCRAERDVDETSLAGLCRAHESREGWYEDSSTSLHTDTQWRRCEVSQHSTVAMRWMLQHQQQQRRRHGSS